MKAQVETIPESGSGSFVARRFSLERFDRPYHFHPEVEITHIVRSQGRRVIGDHIGEFQEGDLYLLGPNLPHGFSNTRTPPEGAEAEVLHFAEGIGGGFFEVAPECRAWQPWMRLSVQGLCVRGETAALAGALLLRIREASGPRRWALFLELVDCLCQSPLPSPLASPGFAGWTPSPGSERLQRVCAHILEHFADDLRHEDLATMAHFAPTAFSRAFRSATGKTYSRFLQEVRLGHACRLLSETPDTVTSIAFASGFRNLANFNRQFRAAYGCCPRDYRSGRTRCNSLEAL
jgi:AraC-like DNA-binding protein